jgi:hypothetical protein
VDDIWAVGVVIVKPDGSKSILYMATRSHILQHNRLLTCFPKNINPKTLDDHLFKGFIVCNRGENRPTRLVNRLAVEKHLYFNWL